MKFLEILRRAFSGPKLENSVEDLHADRIILTDGLNNYTIHMRKDLNAQETWLALEALHKVRTGEAFNLDNYIRGNGMMSFVNIHRRPELVSRETE